MIFQSGSFHAVAIHVYTVVRQFAIMTVVWGIVGMLVGLLIAAQLIWPELNLAPWLSYGRLRPLHTNAVIFAFGGCALFATSYYVVQRTCHTRLFGNGLAAFTFWGWQLVIVLAVVSLPLGITSSKEYAELEWPIDILITLVWVAYAVVFFGTVAKRKTPHIYVANWFFGAPGEKVGVTGHAWDGDLQEWNNPLPGWWMWLFYITIVFALAYLFLYPGLGSYGGYFKWSSQAQYQDEQKEAAATFGPIIDKYLKQDIQQVAMNPEAREIGHRLFLN